MHELLPAQPGEAAADGFHREPEMVGDIGARHRQIDAIRLATAEEVLELEPDFSRIRGDKVGVVGHHPEGSATLYEVRAFVPGAGVTEDPVTGSLNAGIAQWLMAEGEVPRSYLASQGTRLGREGVIAVEADADGAIWVGGATSTVVRGEITL